MSADVQRTFSAAGLSRTVPKWALMAVSPVTAKLCKTATKLAHVLPIMVAHVEQQESGRSGRAPCDPVADGSPEGMTGGQHRTETNPLVLRSSARAGHFAQLRGHGAGSRAQGRFAHQAGETSGLSFSTTRVMTAFVGRGPFFPPCGVPAGIWKPSPTFNGPTFGCPSTDHSAKPPSST